MRFTTLPLRFFRWYAPLVCLLVLGRADSARAQAGTTTLTGFVYAPISVNNPTSDPLPNVLVYVAPPGVTPPDINHGGNGISGGCAAQTDLVGLTPVVFTTTDYKGSFTLANPALTALGSGTFDIVIQAGKWRRQFPNTQIIAGQINNLGTLNMPSDSTQGDLPKIAVVTGGVDAIECVLRQMGIADTEVVDSSSTAGHINLYRGTDQSNGPGAISSAASTDVEATLMTTNSSTTGNPRINDYDLVMFGCQGNANDPTANSSIGQQNILNYANNGGRVFATHYGYVWLDKPTTFAGAASWIGSGTIQPSSLTTSVITIDQSYPEGVTLANWLQYIGASAAGPANLGQLTGVMDARQDQKGVIKPTQSWGTLNPPYSGTQIGTPVMQFSFDTPIAATGAATISLGFTNTPTNFFEGDPADTVTINVTNTSSIDANNLSITFTLPSALKGVALQGTTGNGWSCNLGSLTCTRSGYLNAGASDPITLTVAVAATGPVGNASITATISGVSLTGANKCGRVLFNEYHVEQPATVGNTGVFPTECKVTTGASNFTPPEKFLEFSLYNLSNFVAPTTTDQILIQGAAVITWNPANPVYYGTPVDDPTIADATASVPGSFAYTIDTTASPIPVGTHTVTLTFTPTDTTDYVPTTKTAQITWLPDPTVSTIDSLDTSIFYGQEIGYNNGVDAVLDVKVLTPPGYPIAVTGGLYTATIDGKDVCHGIEGQPLNPPSGRCDDAAFEGWNAGDHKLVLTYAGDGVDFLPSVSPTYIVHISPDPTLTTLASSVNPSLNLQPITFTADVADVYAAPVGPVTFYDSATPQAACAEPATPCNYTATKIGSVAVVNNVATLTLTTLFHGTHYVSACFTPPLNSDGVISNFFVSCSATVQQVVVLGPTSPLPTQTFLTSSVNPSLVGQAVTFTATMKTSGPFTYTPSGTVTFSDGTTPLNTATVDATGAATFTTSALTLGSHPITAVYSGSPLLAGSTSAVLTQVVTTPFAQAGTGYLLLVNTTTAQVPIGNSGVVQVQIVELNNFNQPVHLSCTGLPAQTTCTFANADIPATGGTTQLTITAAAPHDCNASTPYFVTPSGLPFFGLATLTTLCLTRRRRKLQSLALLAMLAIAPVCLTGCGSGNCTDFGVKPNTYNFTITAASTGTPSVVKYQNMKMRAYVAGE